MRVVALLVFALLAATTVRSVGLVGETSITYTQARPGEVILDRETGQLADGWQSGPLVAAQVRPIERLELGLPLPLAVNSYTGAPADWPAALVWALTKSHAAVVALHVGLGGLLLLLVHRFLRFHGSPYSGAVAMLVLATDWSFLFYRKVLGGTETLLMASGLLVLWSLWSRRWAGGRHGSWAIAVGVGLGLMAKVTFVVTLLALALAALATRWDRPALKPPATPSWLALGGIVVLLTAPLWLTAGHHGWVVPSQGHIQSHDFVSLQWSHLTEGLLSAGPDREAPQTLWWFLSNPLAWFEAAYGGVPRPGLAALRLLGWTVLLAGTVIAWWGRRTDRADALLRLLSVFVPLQLLGLWLANRDLHHLAQASPGIALWFGLASTRLVGLRANPRSLLAGALGVLLALPWMVDGVLKLSRTDAVLASISVPHFLATGQGELQAMLRDNGVEEVHACDYDLYGMLEPLVPELRVVHSWGAVSRRQTGRPRALAGWVTGARGAHLLVVRPSAPMIYNLSPTPEEMAELGAVEVDRLEDGEGWWAVLYAADQTR